MKATIKFLLIFIISMGSFSLTKAIGSVQNVPVQIVFIGDGNNKPKPKKDKSKKFDEDKMKRVKKPSELNKSKRAEKEPVYHPRTIIVV